MTNNENIANIELMITKLEEMIGKENDADNLHGLQTARRYLKFACNHLKNDKLDDAGRCIKIAHEAFKEVRA